MILVVGGAGYLGSHVSSLLGSRCVVYDNLTYRDEFLDNVPFVYGDVTDHDRLKTQLDQASLVVWLAAIVGDAACMINPRRAERVNVEAVRFLADTFHGPIIFTSTASVYGISEEPCTESSPLNPQSIYAETKVEAEKILANSNALILRLGTLYGMSDRMRFDLAINAMTRDAVLKKKITVFGGDQKRPFLNVFDAASFIRYFSGSKWTPGIYNLTASNVTIRNVARLIQKTVFGSEVVYSKSRFEDKRDYAMVSDLNALNLMPVVSIEGAVSNIAGVLREGRIKDPYGDRYVNSKALPRL